MSARNTVAEALTGGGPGEVASAIQAGGLPGITLVEESITQASAASTIIDNVLQMISVRVTTGTAVGPRSLTDAGGTPSATLATVDYTVTKANGMRTTITYEAVITVVTVAYLQRTAPAQYVLDDMVDNSLIDPAQAQLQQG